MVTVIDIKNYPDNNYLFKFNNRNTRKKVRNMFKVNNKNTRTTSVTLFWCFIVSFEHICTFSSVSVVNFEQLNAGWVDPVYHNNALFLSGVVQSRKFQ